MSNNKPLNDGEIATSKKSSRRSFLSKAGGVLIGAFTVSALSSGRALARSAEDPDFKDHDSTDAGGNFDNDGKDHSSDSDSPDSKDSD